MAECTHSAEGLVLLTAVTHPEQRYVMHVVCHCSGCSADIAIYRSGRAEVVLAPDASRAEVGGGDDEIQTGGLGNFFAVPGSVRARDGAQDGGQDSSDVIHGSDPGDVNDYAPLARSLNATHLGRENRSV